LLVGVVDAALGAVDADRVIFAVDLREPVGGLDRFEYGVDINLLHLVDQDDRRIAVRSLLRMGDVRDAA
jgi:hypothetical protein